MRIEIMSLQHWNARIANAAFAWTGKDGLSTHKPYKFPNMLTAAAKLLSAKQIDRCFLASGKN